MSDAASTVAGEVVTTNADGAWVRQLTGIETFIRFAGSPNFLRAGHQIRAAGVSDPQGFEAKIISNDSTKERWTTMDEWKKIGRLGALATVLANRADILTIKLLTFPFFNWLWFLKVLPDLLGQLRSTRSVGRALFGVFPIVVGSILVGLIWGGRTGTLIALVWAGPPLLYVYMRGVFIRTFQDHAIHEKTVLTAMINDGAAAGL